jgi:hypothetical protein
MHCRLTALYTAWLIKQHCVQVMLMRRYTCHTCRIQHYCYVCLWTQNTAQFTYLDVFPCDWQFRRATVKRYTYTPTVTLPPRTDPEQSPKAVAKPHARCCCTRSVWPRTTAAPVVYIVWKLVCTLQCTECIIAYNQSDFTACHYLRELCQL